MKRSIGRLAGIAALVILPFAANAQPVPRHVHRLVPSVQQESRFYIRGPNAPFQNQLRKMTDPLGANGAGR